MAKFRLSYHETGKSEEVFAEFSIIPEHNSNMLHFECKRFSLDIFLRDIVELDEFMDFLSGKIKKIVLECAMEKDAKSYKGRRKITSKGKSISLSQGGVRLEMGDDSKELLFRVISSIKARLG